MLHGPLGDFRVQVTESFLVALARSHIATTLALHLVQRPVHLRNTVGAALGMQAVHVLRQDAGDGASSLQFRECVVRAVGLRVEDLGPPEEAARPVALAIRVGSNELKSINRYMLREE